MGTSQFNPANAGRADFTNLFEELAKARGGCADLDARLDMYEAAISQINTDMEINIEPDISSLKESLRRLLDTGAKNMTQYETAGGIRYCDIPVDLEAGTYHMFFGDLESTDTDGTRCQLVGFLSSESQAHGEVIRPTTTPVLMNRGEGANIEFVVNSKTDRLRIYAGEDKDASLEDDVDFEDAMVCTQTDYELSPTFVTFVPTLAALYQRVLDVELEILQARGGKSSLDGRFDATDDSIAAESTARQAADDVLTTGLAGQIDGGAKNLLGSSTGSGTRFINIQIALKPGKYHVRFGNITSTDTDATTCQFVGFDTENSAVTNYSQLQRGNNIDFVLTVNSETSYVRLYASSSYAAGAGDTVSYTDGMICTEADWAISQKYVPYCPTMPELYQMILDLQSGGASLQSASPMQRLDAGTMSEAE